MLKGIISFLFPFFLLQNVLGILNSQPSVEIKFDTNEKNSFQIFVDKELWFQSSDVFIHQNKNYYSTADNSLSVLKRNTKQKHDQLGNYVEYSFDFGRTEDKEFLFTGFIKLYSNFILFEQFFPNYIADTSIDNADKIVTGFPTFSIADSHGGAGYAQWVSWYYTDNSHTDANHRRLLVAPGFATPLFGTWDSETSMYGGVGGTGATAVFDEKGQTVAILSPFQNPMAINQDCPEPGTLQYGILGNATSIPKGFSIQTILYIDNQGINKAMRNWGSLLRSYYHKAPSHEAKARDLTLQYLGFTTDNGAYYYYNTEANKTYEETLIDVSKYAQNNGIPYKYLLLDSFWYFKGSNGGVSNWSEQPDLFPNKLDYLYQQTGLKIQAHNRYWALDNVYSKNQGGSYEFIEDPVKIGAVPVDSNFWTDLLKHPAEDWGLVVYEQDWLWNEFFQYVSQMVSDVELGRLWLLQMGKGARDNKLTIQYCMPFIRHLFQSLEIDVVTQARASDDYVVGPNEYAGSNPNWRIGGQNLLIDSLGMRPSKDGYWTSSYQPGNTYGEDRYEPNPRIHAASAILTGGPIQIADGIGYSDVNLILQSCMKDGRLLHPSAPATLIDAAFVESALNNKQGPEGAVWFAPSNLPHSSTSYGSLFVAELVADWIIRPSHVGLNDQKQVYFIRENQSSDKVIRWSEDEPLTLKACDQLDFQLWSISPVLSNGWTLLGEFSKWISTSPDRFIDVQLNEKGIRVLAAGSLDEQITVSFLNPSQEIVSVTCTISGQQHSSNIWIGSDNSCRNE